MQQNTLKHSTIDGHSSRASVEQTLEQIVVLAREARRPVDSVREVARPDFPDFTRLLRMSGRFVLVNDIAALFLSFIFAGVCAWNINTYVIGGYFQNLLSGDTLRECIAFTGLGFFAILWLDLKGHYRQRLPYWELVGHIVTVTVVGLVGSGFIEFAFQDSPSRVWTGLNWLLFGVFLLSSRALVRAGLHRRGKWQIPALMIGNGQIAKATLAALDKDIAMGFKVVGQISSESLGFLNQPQAWKQLLRNHGACQVFLALEGSELEAQQAALKSLALARVPYSIVPPWLGLPSSALSPHHFLMQDVLMLHNARRLELPLPAAVKRGFDFVVAAGALVLFAPLFLAVAMMVRFDGRPVFYAQQRVGRHGRLFPCYKFCSMRANSEQVLTEHLARNPVAAEEWAEFQKLKNDVRVTRVGAFIRRTSLDELPQFFNVLKGDMSLVGPRPILQEQKSLYAEDFDFYAAVRPGLTGPWQVSGRNKLSFKQRIALESWYTRNWSFWLDIVILLKTIPVLFEKEQAY